jgi:hypothetical protein
MKRLVLSIVLVAVCNGLLIAQDVHNPQWYSGKYDFYYSLPKGVSMPDSTFSKGGTFDNNDVNKDGLEDYIFVWYKKNRKEGDASFVSVCVQKSDTTFELLKTFNNLYPMYFNSYDPHFKTGNRMLDSLKSKYAGVYPLKDLDFKDDTIIIQYGVGVGETDIEYYVFKDSLNNWYLEKHIFKDDYGAYSKVKEYEVEKNTIPIDSFTYFKW